jgi:NitT/TauT family transport system ATP-binding protein
VLQVGRIPGASQEGGALVEGTSLGRPNPVGLPEMNGAVASASDETGAIKVRHVSHAFGEVEPSDLNTAAQEKHEKSPTVLEAINLNVRSGQFVALVGASGCGKTTLLNMIAGLVRPTSGEVRVSGAEPRCPNLDIGYMFARHSLLPWRTILKNVELGLEVRSEFSRRQRSDRAREMLSLVGLGEYEHYYPGQLSQGMRQRAALARTLAPDPAILLMDEPFAALDAQTKLILQREFLRIWEAPISSGADHQKTVVFVTHDLQEAVLLADRVVVMLPSPGRIARDQAVPLPRPRAGTLAQMMFEEQFQALQRELFSLLEGALQSRPDTEEQQS